MLYTINSKLKFIQLSSSPTTKPSQFLKYYHLYLKSIKLNSLSLRLLSVMSKSSSTDPELSPTDENLKVQTFHAQDMNFCFSSYKQFNHVTKSSPWAVNSIFGPFNYKKIFSTAFLPQNYPDSVFPQYFPFIKWLFLQNTMGAAICVLSTQSLLLAVGVNTSTSLKIAATFQWVIKDALGQIGGIFAAGILGIVFSMLSIGRKFDLDTKRIRYLAVLGLATASLIEISTLHFASNFLLLAGLANLIKNISWVSSSATRASLLRAFSREENLGDLTAKYASQSTAASLLGTGLGLGFSFLFSLSSFSDFFMAYSPFAIGLLYALYKTTVNIRVANLRYSDLLKLFKDFELKANKSCSHSDNLISFLIKYPLVSPESISKCAPLSNITPSLVINHLVKDLKEFPNDCIFYDSGIFLLIKDAVKHITYLWLKTGHSSNKEVVEAMLYALFLNTWDITPENSSMLVKLFLDKIQRESFWILDSFVVLSPEINYQNLTMIGSHKIN